MLDDETRGRLDSLQKSILETRETLSKWLIITTILIAVLLLRTCS